MICIVISGCAARRAGFASAVLRVGIFAPGAGRVAVAAILCCGVSAGAAGGRAAVLTGRVIAPRSVAHAVAGVVIIRIAAIPAIGFAPVLTAGVFLPGTVAVTVAAGIDRFRFGLPAITAIFPVAVSGTGCSAFIFQHPCMTAAGGAGPGTIGAVAVVFVHISPQILNIMALITLEVLLMTS